jgi:hypothetical protein
VTHGFKLSFEKPLKAHRSYILLIKRVRSKSSVRDFLFIGLLLCIKALFVKPKVLIQRATRVRGGSEEANNVQWTLANSERKRGRPETRGFRT